MLEYAKKAQKFSEGIQLEQLIEDEVAQCYLVRCLEVLGEAAYQTSRKFQSRHPEIPWPLIIGMRHRLVHAYTDINMSIVWQTAIDSLPKLLPLLEQILDEAEPNKLNDMKGD